MRGQTLEQRFLEKVEEVESGCHEWRSTIHRDGYGKFWINGEGQVQAHRASWRIFRGAIPDGRWVLHTCDNRTCVNPDHLYLGTPSDNASDKIERFRGLWGKMKFGPEKVAEVRRLRSQGLSQQAIADRLEMHQTSVSRILRGDTLMSKRN